MHVKAALMNIFILATDEMTIYNEKEVSHSAEPTDKYHLTAPPLCSTECFLF